MRNSREAIYGAFASSLQGLTTDAGPTFQTVSRVYRPHTDYAVAQMPAAVIDEENEEADATEEGVLPLYRLKLTLWVYAAAPQISQIPGQESTVPMTAINNILDNLENGPLLNPPPGMKYNTLNGLVQWVRIEGKIRKAVGTGSGNVPVSVAMVPVTIFTT